MRFRTTYYIAPLPVSDGFGAASLRLFRPDLHHFLEIQETLPVNVCKPSEYNRVASVWGSHLNTSCLDQDGANYAFPCCSDILNTTFLFHDPPPPKKFKRCRRLAELKEKSAKTYAKRKRMPKSIALLHAQVTAVGCHGMGAEVPL